MKNKNKKMLTLGITLLLTTMILSVTVAKAQETTEKPIIVCTTSAVGSVVEAYLGDTADVLVLVQPGLCPADFDMKPGYVDAVSKASILFKQNIQGEFWLEGLLEAAGSENLTQVAIPGAYNTPQGAKNYISWVGGNLSQILDVDLDSQISEMLNEVDEVSSWMSTQAETLQASNVNVICMKWLQTFIESAGFTVVATFNPPETLSAGDITALLQTAQTEEVALIADNLQIDVEFGAGIASEVNAEHLVLTNFPGAIPNTETLPKMLRYNAEQLFNSTITWQSASILQAEKEELVNQVTSLQESVSNLEAETSELQNQVTIFQISTSLAVVVVAVLAVLLYARARRK
jgi:ABC-type Zn uptake system ZnuABC Zn-binding protein ZnuA